MEMFKLLLVIYAAATGFCAAGLIGSFYQLVTNKPPRFLMEVEGIVGIISGTLMCAFGGPFILMRNAIRGHRLERRPFGWLAASSAIAATWSMFSGIVLLQFAITLRNAIF